MFLAGIRYEAFVIDYHRLKNWPFGEREHSYTEKDTILYVLGVGLGLDPTLITKRDVETGAPSVLPRVLERDSIALNNGLAEIS
jgi:hypothetical protein